MNHYFKQNSGLESKLNNYIYIYKLMRFEFISDIGLFSKDGMDEGTRILLEKLPPLAGSLLDLGCGNGCIGIVLGKYYKLDVTMSDINDRAISIAKQNADNNNFNATFFHSEGFDRITGLYDIITLNPPVHAGKDAVFCLYENVLLHLKNNGKFYIVIRKKHGAFSHMEKLREVFGSFEILYDKKGIYVLAMEQK